MPLRRLLPLVLLAFAPYPRESHGVIVYRIGAPFSAAEMDSLSSLGIDFTRIGWSPSQLQKDLHLDSLQAESLQPHFFAADDDIAATLLDRGGRACVINTSYSHACNNLDGELLIDQDPTTAHVYPLLAAESFNREIWERVTFDVGGRFLIREVRFRTLADRPDHFLERFTIGIAEGFASNRIPHFREIVAEVKENTEAEVSVLLDPPVTTRAIQLRIFRQTTKEVGLADFELYGGGYVGGAAYESEVIEMEDIASWGEIRWSGRRDPLARVEIRTRSGSDPQPVIFWETRPEQQDSIRFRGGGGSLSLTEYREQYAKLSDFLRPANPDDQVSPDTENWSFWSSPYPFDSPGVSVVSPGPRRFFQVRADFYSTTEAGGKLDFLEFKASVPPAVRALVAEIHPTETRIGEPTRFTYYIRPTIRPGDGSFDGVEVSTPSGIVSVDSLRIAGVDQGNFERRLRGDGLGFEVLLPRKLETADSGALVEIVFSAPVLREVGTLFDGRVFDTTRPLEVRQRLIAGNATGEVESERLSVTTSLSSSLLFSPRAEPDPFTPNGDGVNDLANISYKVLRLTSAAPVSIAIFDLSGRLVRELYAGEDPLGEYSHHWDGTDDSGRRVPPGVYLYRLTIELQSQRESSSGTLSVAY